MVSDNANENEIQGKRLFAFFHNEACKYPQNYNASFDAVVEEIKSRSPLFFQSLGRYQQITGMTDAQIQPRLEKMADDSQGRIPTKLSLFMQAIDPVKEIPDIGIVETFSIVAQSVGETASTIVDKTLDTVSMTGKILPWAIGIGVILIIFLKSKEMKLI